MQIGDNWNGWTIESLIGEGSFGKVYKIARSNLSHTEKSALKVIRIPQNSTEYRSVISTGLSGESVTAYYKGMLEDIVSEFALMSELKGNSNVVSYEDHSVVPLSDSFGWEVCIRMELLTPLYDYLKNHILTIRDVISMGIDISRAVELCQKYNIIHRDIKPENIFISKHGNYKLGDFGIARQMDKTLSGMSKKGTYLYMAPEVYKGEKYNSTVDIYSIGLVLYRFLNNNRPPFFPPYPEPIRYSDSEASVRLRMNGAPLDAPCNATGRLSEIVLKACSFEPKDRYESAQEMRLALEAIEYTDEESAIIYPAGDNLQTVDDEGADSIGFIEKAGTVSLFDLTPQEIAERKERERAALEERRERERREREEKLEQERKEREERLERERREREERLERERREKAELEKRKREERLAAMMKRPAFKVGVTSVLLLLFLMPALYLYFIRQVPEVVGMPESDAKTDVEEAGLVVEATTAFDENVKRGCVISQTHSGERLKRGSTVDLVISRGAAIPAPDLSNETGEAAQEKLEKLGLKLVIEKKEYSDTVKKGCVISQDIEAGTECEQENEIRVVISKGIEQVEVPDLSGKSVDEAEMLLKDRGLVCVPDYYYNSAVESGIVYDQSMTAGEKIDKDSEVTVYVSAGPAPRASSSSSSKKSSKKSSSSSTSSEEIEWS